MKVFFSVLLISIFLNQPIQANTKFYQYNGDIPFIEMMLNMMTAMGMIDKVPPQLLGYGHYYNNPYLGPYAGNAFANQPGLNAPLMMQGINPHAMTGPPVSLMNAQPPCVNEFCGNNISMQLNGVWITRYGEMLGIKNQQFLWSDGRSRYLTGQINLQKNTFSLKVNGNDMILSYQYQHENNRLQTRDSNGIVRNFIRAPMNQGY